MTEQGFVKMIMGSSAIMTGIGIEAILLRQEQIDGTISECGLSIFNLGTKLALKSQVTPETSFVATILPATGFITGLSMRATSRYASLGLNLGTYLCQQAVDKCKQAYSSALEPSKEFKEEADLILEQAACLEKKQEDFTQTKEAINSLLTLARAFTKDDCALIDESKKAALRSALAIGQMDKEISSSDFTYSPAAIEVIVKMVKEVLDSEKTKTELSSLINKETLHQRLVFKTECQEKRLSALKDELEEETRALAAYTEELRSITQEAEVEAAALESILQQAEACLNIHSSTSEENG